MKHSIRLAMLVGAVGCAVAGVYLASGAQIGPERTQPVADPALTSVATDLLQPDTSVPLWYFPYLKEDASKPRFDQMVNGIPIGPTVSVASSGRCEVGGGPVTRSVADASKIAVSPKYVPVAAALERQTAGGCDGEAVTVEERYVIPPADGLDTQLRSKQITWSAAQHGGSIEVFRSYKTSPGVVSDIPSERWSATTISGFPAAVAAPILPMGFGPSSIVVWDGQVQTVVTGIDITLADLIKFAEGLY